MPAILARVDLLVTDDQLQVSQPSTLLGCKGLVVRVVRQGAYPVAELETIQGASFQTRTV